MQYKLADYKTQKEFTIYLTRKLYCSNNIKMLYKPWSVYGSTSKMDIGQVDAYESQP